jgi:hypothetical protein
MDASRYYNSHFKHYAFTWRPAFTQRQEPVPTAEHHPPLVEREIQYPPGIGPHIAPRSALLSTEEIVDKFVGNKCIEDPDRYLSRTLQIGTFLKSANIDTLRANPTAAVLKPMALIDDRNNENVTRVSLNGSCRPSQGPLGAHGLFAELSRSVRLLRCSVSDRSPNHFFSDCLLRILLIL